MKEKRRGRGYKIITVLLLTAMLMTGLSGCGGDTDRFKNIMKPERGNTDAAQTNTEENEENTAMGRYVETVINLKEYNSTGYRENLYKWADGSLFISSPEKDCLLSKDKGDTFEFKTPDWLKELQEKHKYVLHMAIDMDGNAAVIYDRSTEEDGWDPGLMVIKPDGSKLSVDVPLSEGEKYPKRVWLADNGRMFISILGGDNAVYEIKEDGSCEKFLSLTGNTPELIQFAGNLMIMDGYDYNGLIIYDMEKKEYVEDSVLDDFLKENYGKRDFNGDSWYDLYFFPGEEGVLYLAGEKGLHRHVIGGSAIEQIIDGNLSSLGNPAYGLYGMVALENNEFAALFSEGRFVRYTYDASIPTVPNETLKVYSLKNDSVLRTAISSYQTKNPEVYVEYEVGMEENSAITREDALKKLNTRIMAGDGPDLLLLDGMPMDSYVEKGLLLDLSDFINELTGEEELFPNIVEAFRRDGKIYTIPCNLEIPLVSGEKKYTAGMENLAGMAEMIEAVRKDVPKNNILGICSEKGIMKMFAMTCAPTWLTEDNRLDREKLSEFLTLTKRIYDAQMDGLDPKQKENYEQLNEYYMADYGSSYEDSSYFAKGMEEILILTVERELVAGTVYYPYEYAEIISLPKAPGRDNYETILMPGQCEHTFVARTLAGLNAASPRKERAKELLKELLGKENGIIGGLLPVNKAAFEESLQPNSELFVSYDEPYGCLAMGTANGLYAELNIYWMNDEEKAVLRSWVESAGIPYIRNSELEEAVYKEGEAYMKGKQSLEAALNNIEERVALVMAE